MEKKPDLDPTVEVLKVRSQLRCGQRSVCDSDVAGLLVNPAWLEASRFCCGWLLCESSRLHDLKERGSVPHSKGGEETCFFRERNSPSVPFRFHCGEDVGNKEPN